MGGLTLIRDRSLSGESTEAVLGLNDPDAGRLVIHATPGHRRLHGFASDAARALGKTEMVGVSGREGRELWRALTAWVVAAEIRQIVLGCADGARIEDWNETRVLAEDVGAELVLHVRGEDPLPRGQREWIQDHEHQRVELTSWITLQSARTKHREEPDHNQAISFPRVPTTEFPLFKADCRRLLDPDDFDRAHDETERGRQITADAIDSGRIHPDHPRQGVNAILRTVIGDCLNADQALCRIRGAQTVLAFEGWALRVEPHHLTYALQDTSPLDQNTCTSLQRLVSTRHAAAVVLCLLAQASPEALAAVTMGDTGPADVTIDGRHHTIPDCAQTIWQALLNERLTLDARPEDPLLSQVRRGSILEAPSPRAMRMVLTEAGKATGLSIWGEHFTQARLADHGWLTRRGIKVVAL